MCVCVCACAFFVVAHIPCENFSDSISHEREFLEILTCDEARDKVCDYIYGVALVSRIDKMIGLFCKRALLKRRSSAKETYNLVDPTNRSRPVISRYILLADDRCLLDRYLVWLFGRITGLFCRVAGLFCRRQVWGGYD